jgi:hypothetical protein
MLGSSRKYPETNMYKEGLPKQNSHAQHQRETMNKWDFIKLKSFCTARETVTRLKRAQGMGENLW